MSIGYQDNYSIDDIAAFVRENPQGPQKNPRYFFIGGTAVRLNQELGTLTKNLEADNSSLRPVSDFDIMIQYGEKPTNDAFFTDSDPSFNWTEGVPKYMISAFEYQGQTILLTSPTLTIGSKIVMTDAPRKKDYEDYCRLESLLDREEMSEVFKRAIHIKDSAIASDLYDRMSEATGVVQENYFRCLREAANILSEFPQAQRAIDLCLQEKEMDSTMINRVVLYNLNRLLVETKDFPASCTEQLAMEYAEYCHGRSPHELDREFTEYLIPMAKKRLEQLRVENH